MTEKSFRIFIVDDHPLVREWLANLIHQQPDMRVCGEAENVRDARRAIAKTTPDIAIVDLSLDDSWGLDLIKALATDRAAARTIVLSMHNEKFWAERAIRAGARGYITKRETAKNIVSAIRCVLGGKIYLSEKMQSELALKFVGAATPAEQSPFEQLTERELEVFRLLGRGLGTNEVARSIGISAKTVHTYCARIREKMQLKSGAELVREAIRWDSHPEA